MKTKSFESSHEQKFISNWHKLCRIINETHTISIELSAKLKELEISPSESNPLLILRFMSGDKALSKLIPLLPCSCRKLSRTLRFFMIFIRKSDNKDVPHSLRHFKRCVTLTCRMKSVKINLNSPQIKFTEFCVEEGRVSMKFSFVCIFNAFVSLM